MIRVVGPITGFLFVVNCDSGRRSRQAFMPGYAGFRRSSAAKRESYEFEIGKMRLAQLAEFASQTLWMT
jgi:hypothetical protein